MGRRVLAAALVLSLLPFAGCFGDDTTRTAAPADSDAPTVTLSDPDVAEGLARATALQDDPFVYALDVAFHIVFVGVPAEKIDEERIRRALPPDYSPWMDWSPRPEDGLNSQIVYRLSYEFHHAPDAFGDEMFAFAASTQRETPSNRLLQRYNADYALGKSDERVLLLDAEKTESWIAGNRSRFGLEWEKPSYTIFFLDAETPAWLPTDTFHYWEFKHEILDSPSSKNMRAWGGTYDFLFLDLSAAPNWDTFDQSKIVEEPLFGLGVPAREGTAYNDPPIWHYEGRDATVGSGPTEKSVNINDAIGHDIAVAANLRILESYAYRPVYKPTYFVNLRLYHDGRSQYPKDLETQVDLPRILASLQAEIPWATVTGEVTTCVLPACDPGMDRALTLAKAQGAGSYIPTKPVTDYVDANPERFNTMSGDVFNVKALLFLLEGHYAFVLPVIVGGVALQTEDAQAWGTISSLNDVAFAQGTNAIDGLTFINAHEVGHFFGLWHNHDGMWRGEDGQYAFRVDHTWSQTNSVMSYRITPFTADTFNRETIARAHTVDANAQAIRNVVSAYRVLQERGEERVPRGVQGPLAAAEEALNTALRLYDDGMAIDAVYAAIDALAHSRRALDAAGTMGVVESKTAEWDATGVHHAGVKWATISDRSSAAIPGLVKDYREVPIDRDVESIRIRVTWTNAPASWGDFFVGWDTDWNVLPFLPLPAGVASDVVHPFTPFGVHDVEAEGPADGAVAREIVLPLEMFPILYERGRIFAGAGVMGDAVNGAYHVEVFLTKRVYGGAADGAAAGEGSASPQHEPARHDLVRVPVQDRVLEP